MWFPPIGPASRPSTCSIYPPGVSCFHALSRGANVHVTAKHLKLIAFLMALTIIAHDGVMAGDVHRPPTAPVEAPAADSQEGHAGHPHRQHEADSPDRSDPDSECGTLAEVRPNQPELFRLELPLERSSALPDGSNSLLRPADRAIEPDHPPDVLRALLQVFLN